jgi:hypothetical protein
LPLLFERVTPQVVLDRRQGPAAKHARATERTAKVR